MEYYGHSRNAQGQRQLLTDHLQIVAKQAAAFAASFAAADVAHLLGLWHDLGKFNPAFQDYLRACEGDGPHPPHGPDHKAAGSHLASQHVGLLSLIIQAHHGGLQSPSEFKQWLAQKLADPATLDALAHARAVIPNLIPAPLPTVPADLVRDALAAEMYLRFLLSALVDADHLDTERHFNPDKTAYRGSSVSIAQLWERFDRHQQRFASSPPTLVNQARQAIYADCLAAADQPPGLFRLAVPTGGGKTLSGMAFALRHALRHGLERVIVAVPFISITQQNAAVYRTIFDRADDPTAVVLEHHSAVAVSDPANGDFSPSQVWARLASENWDASIVVTTTVQLFESLFANRTGDVRKLHRLARSVIILDEAQSLPPPLLDPILSALRELCQRYHASVVLSTATQPAFDVIRPFADLPARDIVPDPARWFQALKRVDYDWQTETDLTWDDVAKQMRSQAQALAIVNTKKDALALLDALADPDALHLSTSLCGAHRQQVIDEVRRRLKAGAPCRLVSTQVVEAGVDIDFPLVLRALGPLDSIIQAAGRCNREGRLSRGQVIVFRPAGGGMPFGAYKAGAGFTEVLRTQARLDGRDLDPDDPDVARAYFQRLFQAIDIDREGIQALRTALNYPEVARNFRMIDDDTVSVVVPYGTPKAKQGVQSDLQALRDKSRSARLLLRRLQPYTVSIRRREADRLTRIGLIDPIMDGVGEWMGQYDTMRGLLAQGPDPDVLII